MINHDEELSVDKNDNGELIDDDGDVIYCDNEYCEFPAVKRVVVSVDSAHDETRDYCASCAEVYMVGVQHGRYHESATRGDVPGRCSSQYVPYLKPGYGPGKSLTSKKKR